MSTYQDTILYNVRLPQFINNFKSHIINCIVPRLQSIRQVVNEQQNSQYVNQLVTLLVIGVIFFVVRNVWVGLFGKRQQSQERDFPEMNTEVNDLKKQLKALRISFNQLTKELNNKQQNLPSQNPISSSHLQKPQSPTLELINILLPLYDTSLTQNKSLVNYVLESQFQVLKQLKRFKKLYKNSVSSSGRPSISTIRSKTSQKKLQKEKENGKSPSKIVAMTLESEVKKTVVKITEKPLLSEISSLDIISGKSLLLKSALKTPKNQIKTNQLPKIPKSEKTQIPEKNISEKQQMTMNQEQKSGQRQELIMPVTSAQQTPVIQIKSKVEVQTIVQKSKFSENIESPGNMQMTFQQEFSQSITETQRTVRQNVQLQTEQFGEQIEATGNQSEENVVFAPPKLPIIKKMVPPTSRLGGKRPPPPPTRK